MAMHPNNTSGEIPAASFPAPSFLERLANLQARESERVSKTDIYIGEDDVPTWEDTEEEFVEVWETWAPRIAHWMAGDNCYI